MELKAFYGLGAQFIDIPDGNVSEAESLSDDENMNREEIDPESEPESKGEVDSEVEYDSEDDIPLINFVKPPPSTENNPEWRICNLLRPSDEIKFLGCEQLPPEILNLESPFQFFRFFFTDEILTDIVYQSNLYSVQSRPDKPLRLTQTELQQFIGICLFMSIIQLPACRHYWNSTVGHPLVSKIMTCNRWEEIKCYLHFNDNTMFVPQGQVGHDKLYKLRPLLTKLQNQLLLVPKEELLAIDEQIIPTKARTSLKQYNPKKPHKWGYKAYVLSGISGFSYDYEIFAGSQSNVVPQNAPDLGVSSNVVLRMAASVPRHLNYKLFFDNWFTSLPLQIYLTKEGILPLGTVRINRIKKASMPTENEMKKKGRGTVVEKVADVNGVKVSLISWFDNKVVNLMSTYVGSQPMVEVKRFSKKDNSHITLPSPQAVKIYNNYMGGLIQCSDITELEYGHESGT